MKIWKKLGLESWNFGQNMVENAKIFSKNWKQGAQEQRIDGKLVG